MRISQFYRKLKFHLPVPKDNTLFKTFYIAKAYTYQKISLRIFRSSWPNIEDLTEEAWSELGTRCRADQVIRHDLHG